uniref:Uncharacterized protein n=1 Tax=Anguilla anguilla TaxID=7936 RepID=A0A0E9TAS0_ANGAN
MFDDVICPRKPSVRECCLWGTVGIQNRDEIIESQIFSHRILF